MEKTHKNKGAPELKINKKGKEEVIERESARWGNLFILRGVFYLLSGFVFVMFAWVGNNFSRPRTPFTDRGEVSYQEREINVSYKRK